METNRVKQVLKQISISIIIALKVVGLIIFLEVNYIIHRPIVELDVKRKVLRQNRIFPAAPLTGNKWRSTAVFCTVFPLTPLRSAPLTGNKWKSFFLKELEMHKLNIEIKFFLKWENRWIQNLTLGKWRDSHPFVL